ncbi:MAG: UTP--glucose-1-phosphate uridylyltransferase [Candidatus Margulisbacteria bacterium]|nr:UTP--glucose-1-phosphate uridylyltransferase [Candidatus Margulisiibacteriota bacterium]MBU1729846.1 UTP--glucose-1-phosphate uridylyltransferase [Candidatus Margulisiibacteriota bacterium]MBU1768014.1 UTP--glucose-1-phosphate uridylyltransferase [Candidatus Omnitrophota bacterium]
MSLAIRLQNALRGKGGVIRIDHAGEVQVNGLSIGNSYGSKHLAFLMQEEDRQQRELVIVANPTISGKKIESFLTGINTGNISAINTLQGCGIVFIKDYNLLSILRDSNVAVVKASPKLTLADNEYETIATFFKKNHSVLRDFRWFNPTQRIVVLRLLSRNLLNGLFNFWEVLDARAKTRLLEDLTRIDVEQIFKNIEIHREYIDSGGQKTGSNVAQIKGRQDVPNKAEITDLSAMEEPELSSLAERGKRYMETGRFGVVVMAAGAAARFGRGPKALVNVEENRSFMRIAAEDVLAASRKAGKEIPLFVMVSPANGEAIKQHFHENRNFGLIRNQVFFFYQTDVSPKIYPDGNLALTPDKTGIDFAPTGHGFVVKGIMEQVAPICQQQGIKTLVIKNIDNLGSTVQDASYEEVLGNHISSGKGVTVELVPPKVSIDPATNKKKLLDKGGGALSLDSRNVLVELFAVPKELQDKVAENPFNTLTLTVEVDALAQQANPQSLPWYITHKDFTVGLTDRWRRFQFEQLLGDLTHQIDTNFVIVAREGGKGRFLPVKLPEDLAEIVRVFKEMEEKKAG